ncbi:MAG: immunoglobulin-like domain-containing protein, partial [Bombilactobacillus sp.]
YLSFVPPVVAMKPLKGIVTINYVPGYGVNLWKTAGTTGGYYSRKLPHGSKWQVFGSQNGFYNLGKNQWLQAQYAKFN